MSAIAVTRSLGSTKEPTSRLLAPDAFRGLIIVLMAWDHANVFIAQKHSGGEHWGGAFPAYDDALSFLARLVTHPAAPGFAFLVGVGMVLFAQSRRGRGWSEWEIIRHFLIRGSILIALQLLVVNQAWRLGPDPFPGIYQGVLVALGGGMILGSFLLRVRPVYLLILSAILFVGMEVTHPDPSEWGHIFGQPLGLIFGYSGGDASFWSNYPILPWLELVVFGMVFGHWLATDRRRAYRRALVLGVTCLAAFVLIRAADGFGNIRPRAGDSWIDFLNVVKYPPAMTFTLLAMGFNLIVLWSFAWVADHRQQILSAPAVFGRTPLFFYILHLFLYAFIGWWLTPGGTSIPAMVPYWLLGLIVLFPLCVWFADFKQRAPQNAVLRFL